MNRIRVCARNPFFFSVESQIWLNDGPRVLKRGETI